jgi:hypothetical protein
MRSRAARTGATQGPSPDDPSQPTRSSRTGRPTGVCGASACKASATSAVLRASTPIVQSERLDGRSSARGTWPGEGANPITPHSAAG